MTMLLCIWRQLGPELQGILQSINDTPARLDPSIRNKLNMNGLLKMEKMTPDGTIWTTSLTGRAVIRAAREAEDQDDV